MAVVTDNRVRVRSAANTSGEILGHLYDNEIAWVLERSQKQETIGGQTSYWYKIKMWDDREGWVFGAFLSLRTAAIIGNMGILKNLSHKPRSSQRVVGNSTAALSCIRCMELFFYIGYCFKCESVEAIAQFIVFLCTLRLRAR